MDALTSQLQGVSLSLSSDKWVDKVYHATDLDEDTLQSAEKSETLVFANSEGTRRITCPCSLFSCNLWCRGGIVRMSSTTGDGRPTISPYASNRVVISATDVLANPDDYLLPIKHDDNWRWRLNAGGCIYIEMVYIRREDVCDIHSDLTQDEQTYLNEWELGNHPFVRLEGDGLRYRAIDDVWWIMLTPYEVPIPTSAIWEKEIRVMGNDREEERGFRRTINNPVTLKLARNLAIFTAAT